MDSQGPSPVKFSLSRLLSRYFRQIYAHKLQFYTSVLRFCARSPILINLFKLGWHMITHPPSFRPDLLAFLLSISAKLIWILLFRDPAAFLWFKRPARGYQGIVYGTVVLTTIPNILVHVWALLISLENKWNSITPVGVEMAVFATVSLIPPTGFAWWMAWKFLLGAEDGEEDFQPTVKSFGAERQTVSSSDAVHNCNTFVFTDVADGFLNRAYEAQRLIPRTTTPSSITYSAEAGAISPTREERALVEEPRGLDQTPLNGQSNAPRPPRCQTIARFEYMSQSHSGFLSWFSYPIFRLILLVITTIFLIAVLVLVYEDSHYRFRTPQPTLKRSLYLPLGNYILYFYILKHRLRASLFEHFHISLPGPWRKKTSIFPSWASSKDIFINEDTGDITTYDPSYRSLSLFPRQGRQGSSSIRAREYIASYNANPGACTTFWGHSGRQMETKWRFLPTMQRIGFIFLAGCLTLKGFLHTVHYHPPVLKREWTNHPNLTEDDVAQIIRIRLVAEPLRFFSGLFIHPVVSLAPLEAGCMLYLFFSAAWKYTSSDTKATISGIFQRSFFGPLIETEGRIRLD